MLRKGMFLADRYEIIEQIGTGGMSNVYKAKCHKLNRFVAIKVLKQEFNEDRTFVSKFRAEAQSAAGLTHPNIVNVYDVGDENGIYYIVMELIEGITLKKYIEKRGRIPYKEAVSIAIQVANGMEAAHKHNIVHRDIKPQNIIISKEGKVKVTDFGIAKAASSSTITSSAMGSVHYISPEQARGGYSDARSDIYSFGITLFEMLTGKVPFDGDTTVAVAVQHIQDEIPAPSTLSEDIPISVDQIVLKCTQKKVERRYQNASELITDLKRSLVMPNDNFVKMAPVFAAINTDNIPDSDDDQVGLEDEDADDDLLNEDDDILNDDEDDDDDDLLDDDEDDKKSKKKKKNAAKKAGAVEDEADIDDESNDKLDMIFKWIGVGIIAIILIIIIFVVVKFVGGGSSSTQEETTTQQEETTTEEDNSSDKVEVPDVVNMTEDEAKAALNKVGLGYKATTKSSDTVDEGTVISQGTKAGTKVAKNTTITLTVSSGPASVTVPSVVGVSESSATSTLKGDGFTVDVQYEYSDTVESGYVIRQTPNAKTSAGSGDTVTIYVSQGKQITYVTVPTLVGKTYAEAAAALESVGLKSSLTSGSSSDSDAEVTNAGYAAGDTLAEGSVVPLTTKAKVTTTTLSNTVNLTVAEAIDKLTGDGIKTTNIFLSQSITSSDYSNYIVTEQTPTTTTDVSTQQVKLTISKITTSSGSSSSTTTN